MWAMVSLIPDQTYLLVVVACVAGMMSNTTRMTRVSILSAYHHAGNERIWAVILGL